RLPAHRGARRGRAGGAREGLSARARTGGRRLVPVRVRAAAGRPAARPPSLDYRHLRPRAPRRLSMRRRPGQTAAPVSAEPRARAAPHGAGDDAAARFEALAARVRADIAAYRSEEHTSELQSRENLVCRLLLDKKKT